MKKNAIVLSVIILIGFLLRMIFINKPDGLWNDEYISWYIASTPLFNGFVEGVKSQCHMPLYYLYLKLFMKFFGQSDLLLRLTSLLPGIISILVMYFAGKELSLISSQNDCNTEKSVKCGLLCAGFTSVSSFLIYYSQEVRFYSLLFLFSALYILYTLKIINNPIRKNFVLYIISGILIMLTHTIGFVFVFFNLLFVSFYLFKRFKKLIIIVWSVILASFVLFLPLILKIFMSHSFSQWWNNFSLTQIGFLLTDYFSPVLTNLTSAPDKFLYNPSTSFYMIVPMIIAVICIVKSAYKNKLKTGLLLICIATVITLIIASLLGKLVFITKYSIEIYPILILLLCSVEFNNRLLKTAAIIFYSIASLSYILIYPYSAPKMHRSEGHKIVADIIGNMKLKEGDWILLEYYPKSKFKKYIDFSHYKTLSIDKGNFYAYMSDGLSYEDVYKNGKVLYKDLFLSDNNTYLGNKLKKKIFDKMRVGQSIVMVTLDSVSFYSPNSVKEIAQDESLYKKTPFLFLVFSYLKKETFYDMQAKLAPQRIEKKGSWTVIKFTKVNN